MLLIRRQFGIGTGWSLAAVLCIPLGTALMCAAHPGFAADRQVAPVFSLQDVVGNEHSLAGYRGKVVLLNFWATSCPPCIHEMPGLELLYNSLKDRGFVVLAVSSDDAGQRAVKPVVDRLALSFPVLLDPGSKVTGRYGVSLRPTSYLIDRDGYLVSRILGVRDWMGAEQLTSIRALMRSSPPGPGDHDVDGRARGGHDGKGNS